MTNPALALPDAPASVGDSFKSLNQQALSDELPQLAALRAGQNDGSGNCEKPAGTSWSRRGP